MRITIWAALLLTALTMGLTLRNGWVYLDDLDMVLNNDAAIHFNIGEIWLRNNRITYTPLAVTTLAAEYHFAGDKPFLYHLNNLLLHLLVVWLIYQVLLQLYVIPPVAAMAALIFGIHPMHVESVAWITERKDVLYATFYLAALSMYIDYVKLVNMGRPVVLTAKAKHLKKDPWVRKWLKEAEDELSAAIHPAWPDKVRWNMLRRKWWLAFLALILSLFAKPMALSFAFIAWLIDWRLGRRWSKSILIDKLPFLAASVIIASVTFYGTIMRSSHILDLNNPELEDRLLYLMTSCVFYPAKFFLPANFSPIYVFPSGVNTDNLYYQLVIAGLVAWVYSLWLWRNHKWWTFANLFYILSAWFLWRLHDNDFHHVADRFMYLPSLGYCLLVAIWLHKAWDKGKWAKLGTVAILSYLMICCSGATRHWYSEYSMYNRALSMEPKSFRLIRKMADYYRWEDNPNREMEQANRAIELDQNNVYWLNRRAAILEEANDTARAYIDYYRVIFLYDYYVWPKDEHYYTAFRGVKRNESKMNQNTGKTKVIRGKG